MRLPLPLPLLSTSIISSLSIISIIVVMSNVIIMLLIRNNSIKFLVRVIIIHRSCNISIICIPLPLPPPLIILRLLLISIVLIILLLLHSFGRSVVQPKQALLEGFEWCITAQIEFNRGFGGRITPQAEILRVGGVYYIPNRI